MEWGADSWFDKSCNTAVGQVIWFQSEHVIKSDVFHRAVENILCNLLLHIYIEFHYISLENKLMQDYAFVHTLVFSACSVSFALKGILTCRWEPVFYPLRLKLWNAWGSFTGLWSNAQTPKVLSSLQIQREFHSFWLWVLSCGTENGFCFERPLRAAIKQWCRYFYTIVPDFSFYFSYFF